MLAETLDLGERIYQAVLSFAFPAGLPNREQEEAPLIRAGTNLSKYT